MRYKLLSISADLLLNLFAPGIKPIHEIVEGVPTDAKIVNVRHGWPNQIDILLSSGEFPVVQDGEPIPHLTITSRLFATEIKPL